jgi:hypothetical protein
MKGGKGWGRADGRAVLEQLLAHIEARPEKRVFRVSMDGIEQMDASFASEAIVGLIRRYRGEKGICLENLSLTSEVAMNIDLAAEKAKIPVVVWNGRSGEVLGWKPSSGNRPAFEFALKRPQARAAEFAETVDKMSIANASTKFKQLWEKGFLLRSESAADSGGVEFVYERIG